MKAAIYINEGTTQIVLTPENQWEINSLKLIQSSEKVAKFWGEFYECRGGWYRESSAGSNESLIFRIDKPEPEAVA